MEAIGGDLNLDVRRIFIGEAIGGELLAAQFEEAYLNED